MRKKEEKPKRTCQVCRKDNSTTELVPSSILRQPISEFVKKQYPQWSPDGFICLNDLRNIRYEYFYSLLKEERGELSSIEKEVIES